MRGEATDDPPEQPRWGGTWARRILDLPGVDPSRFFHFGLRGPRNDREVFDRFTEKGVQRSHVYTFGDIWRARRGGFDPWAQSVAQQIAEGAAKVWIAIDVDVIDMSAGPDWGDEPLGPRAEEVCWLCYEVGRAAGWQKFGGISFMAVPNAAMSTHWMCVYIMLYTLAGTIHGATA
jgi:arginase family enzyme